MTKLPPAQKKSKKTKNKTHTKGESKIPPHQLIKSYT